MVSYTNFFETIQEAEMRLKNSIVKYRDDFYYVEAVSGAKADGKFRVYMDQLGHGGHGQDRLAGFGYPNSYDFYGDEFSKALDKWLEENPDKGFARKYASSRHFNKFRPFPLGNVNVDGAVVYCERGPTRNMHQGLREPAVLSTNVSTVPVRYDPNSRARSSSYRSQVQPIGNSRMDIFSREFYNMLKGDYPSFQESIELWVCFPPRVFCYERAFRFLVPLSPALRSRVD